MNEALRTVQRAKTFGKVSSAAAAVEPMTKDEVDFCWRTLADNGKLSLERLQAFMQDVAGEELSLVEAGDLLEYMDADDNETVGKNDFEYFMRLGSLKDTDAKSFMWTPKDHYGKERSEKNVAAAQASAAPAAPADGASSSSSMPSPSKSKRAALHRRDSCDMAAVSAFFKEKGSGAAEAQAIRAPSEPLSPTADSGQGPQSRTQSPRKGRPGALASQPTTPLNRAKLSKQRSKRVSIPEELEPGTAGELRAKAKPLDRKVLDKIDAALEKYEQASWQRFLQTERDYPRTLFSRVAADADEMTAQEYNKLLMKWQKYARWSLPGDVTPGDTIASLEYILHRETERGASAPPSTSREEAPALEASVAKGEVKLPLRVWEHLVKGKYRPTTHLAPRPRSR